MKLLQVISTMDPKTGGPSQGIRNLNPLLTISGIEVEVLCLDDPFSDYKDSGLFHTIGKGKTSYQFHLGLKKWIIKNASQFDFIIVHGIWQFHNYAVYKALKVLKRQGVKVPKVVIMPHGMLDPYFQKSPDRKLKAIRNEVIWRITEKRAINAADAIFFTCQEELELARLTFLGYRPKKEMNVGYGIQHPPNYTNDMKIAFEQCCPTIKDKKYWLFLSRIHPKKGIDVLIKVYNELSKDGKNLPELVIAGPTESNYAQKMLDLAKGNKKIHFSGMLNESSKWGALYNCNVFLLPSHQENFGIAIIEALACKKPVLITKKINIWKKIVQGNGAWILDEPNSADFKDQLLAITNLTVEELDMKGKMAYDVFVNKFQVDSSCLNFINALKSLK
jgi:glycosyltransferase involved in cell wall biosynthesis